MHAIRLRRFAGRFAVAAALLLGCREDPLQPDASSQSMPVVGHPGLGLETVPLDGVPFAVAINSRGTFYVTQLIGGGVVSGKLPSTTLSAPLPVGSITSQVRMSPDGRTVYPSNQDEGTIPVIRVQTNTITATIQGAPSILTTGVSPDGRRIYALTDFHGIDIIDTRTQEIIGNIPVENVGTIGVGIAFDPIRPRMYVTARDEGRVTVIGLPGHTVDRTLFVPGGRMQNVAVSRDGARLYGTDIERSKLIVWDLNDLDAPFQEVSVGSPVSRNAFDVAVTPDDEQLYVTGLADGAVYVLDRASLAPLATLLVGGSPRYVAFNAEGTHAIIPNESGYVTFVHAGGAPPPPPAAPAAPPAAAAPIGVHDSADRDTTGGTHASVSGDQ